MQLPELDPRYAIIGCVLACSLLFSSLVRRTALHYEAAFLGTVAADLRLNVPAATRANTPARVSSRVLIAVRPNPRPPVASLGGHFYFAKQGTLSLRCNR